MTESVTQDIENAADAVAIGAGTVGGGMVGAGTIGAGTGVVGTVGADAEGGIGPSSSPPISGFLSTLAVTRVPIPAPVLGPYLGLVAAVLCVLGGGWLLLAPYALDLRHGAARLPRAAQVDLETGAAIAAVGIVTTALFAFALARRLRTESAADEYESEGDSEDDDAADVVAEAELSTEPESEAAGESGDESSTESGDEAAPRSQSQSQSQSESESGPEPDPDGAPQNPESRLNDPASSLREMLTPLVAALAADLRSQTERAASERSQRDKDSDGRDHR